MRPAKAFPKGATTMPPKGVNVFFGGIARSFQEHHS